MTVTYCTAVDVATILNALAGSTRLAFSVSTIPTLVEVEEMIEDMEQDIDTKCNQSWKLNSVSNEFHDFHGRTSDGYGKYSYAFNLLQRNIRALDSGEGDKFEIWNGSSWIDWLADGKLGSGPYDEHFYVDINRGRVYIYDTAPQIGPSVIRVTYRYGLSNVPRNIKRATALLVAMHLLKTTESMVITADSAEKVMTREILDSWSKEVEEISSSYDDFGWI